MHTVLIVIHLMVVLALIGVVLIQRSEGGGLGIGGGGGGGGGGFFTARGTANVLTRATAILAGIFFITSLAFTILAGWGRTPPALLNQPAGQQGPAVPGGGSSILDQIRPQTPAPAPQAPASQVPVPQVPAQAAPAPAATDSAPAPSAPAAPAPAPAAPAPAAPAPGGSQAQ